MQGYIDKYKYYIGGSTISIILFFIIYNNLVNIDDTKLIKPNKEKIILKLKYHMKNFYYL